MAEKQANTSEAGWALVMEGITSARVDSHRLRKLLGQIKAFVDHSPDKELWHQMSGDILLALPGSLDRLDRSLDRTLYALAKIGEEHLRDRLSVADRAQVEDGVSNPRPFSRGQLKGAERLARLFLEKNLGGK